MRTILEELENLEFSIKNLDSKYRNILQENQELHRRLDSAERTSEEFLEQLDIRGNEIDKLKIESVKLNAVIADKNKELNIKLQREEELEVQNNEQRQRIETLELEIAQILSKNEVYLEKVKGLNIERTEVLNSINSKIDSDEIIDELCSEIEIQQKKNQELLDKLSDINENYNLISEQNKNLFEQIANLKKINIDLEYDLEKTRSEFEYASANQVEMSKFKNRSVELNEIVQKMETENEILKAEVTRLAKENSEERDAGRHKINALMSEVSNLRNIALPENARSEIEETIHQAMRLIDKHI